MLNGNKLCYVASGLQFAKFLYKEAIENKEVFDLVANWLKRINNANGHYFSVLFNAFAEKKIAEPLQYCIKPYVYDVHSDSGGLQIISRKMNITPELKKQIYEIQAKYSDVAMSFDEIPVYTLVQRSELKDAKNKVFDRSRLEECAKQTAKNITEQIQYFLDSKSKTRPLAIIQGNDLETALKWAEILLKEIPKSMHEVISGVAMGSPALGVGELEEIKKLFWFTQMPQELKNNHLHILGVGAMKRFVPTLVFIRSGLLKDTFISYDSTTHTSMNTFGRYYYGEKPGRIYQITYNRNYSKDYEEMYEDMLSIFPELKNWCENAKKLHFFMNINPKHYVDEHGTRVPIIVTTIAHALSCIYNFTKHVEDALKDEEILYKMVDEETTEKKYRIRYVDKTKRKVYKELEKIKTLEDYLRWEAELGRFLKSKPVRSNHVTLDGFFA